MTLPAPASLPWQRDLLERALALEAAGRLPHAILIDDHGQRDSGSLVMQLAALLLCDAPDAMTTCGQCEACRLLAAGTYADFSLVTRLPDEKTKKISKNIKIDQIRDLIHEVSLTPRYGRMKIAAIYPAETMSREGANALLKTLEEPAPDTLLLLVTHNPGRIPITLRSRCQCWTLHRPAAAEALAWLETRGLDSADARRYLDYARGDPALAVELEALDFAGLVARFKQDFAGFIRGDRSVAGLGRELLGQDADSVRRLLEMTLRAYCLRASGVDADGNATATADPACARALFDLRQRAGRQLQVEDNNLDFRIQLEDVLISLQQILQRRTN